MRSLLPMPHEAKVTITLKHMFRVMVTLASCFMMGKAMAWGTFAKQRDGTRLTPRPMSLLMGNWNPHSLGISPHLMEDQNVLNNII